ncbi:hypothetical protein Hdeb2414_s0003g00091401 [Helianthus debilis subsp. tardiflorus]
MKRKRSSTRVNINTPVNCNALGNRDHPWLQFADFEAKYTKRLESLWPRRCHTPKIHLRSIAAWERD